MWLEGTVLPWLLSAVFAILGLAIAGGLLHRVRATRARLRLREAELVVLEKELQERSGALAEAEGEIDRLKRIPKAELLPMLKLAHEQRSPLAAIQNALDMLPSFLRSPRMSSNDKMMITG